MAPAAAAKKGKAKKWGKADDKHLAELFRKGAKNRGINPKDLSKKSSTLIGSTSHSLSSTEAKLERTTLLKHWLDHAVVSHQATTIWLID
jgi:hypothetical protein